jgi:hypothetical protein
MRTPIYVLLVFGSITLPYTDSLSQTSAAKGQLSKETNQIVRKIEQVNVVMNSAVGEGGERPEQYDNFVKLKDNATSEELIKLTAHSNPAVRCYAFWALTGNPSVDLFPIVLAHLNDNETVETLFGCIISEEKVGDFFIDILVSNSGSNANLLTTQQQAALDSVLIYSPNALNAKSAAIARVAPTESLYPKFRDMVVRQHDQSALVTLAKYQKAQDVELILQNQAGSKPEEREYFATYQAIRYFPHPDFFPLLEKNLQLTLDKTHFSSEWRQLYSAIAVYKNRSAYDLLEVPFTQVKHKDIRKYHLDFVFEALRAVKEPLYDDLLWKLWADENRLTPDVLKYLSGKNPDRVFELTKKSLAQADRLYSTNISINFDDLTASQDITTSMIELVMKRDKDFAIEIIRQNLRKADVHLFPIFARKATELKDPSLIDPLFYRLEREWNAYIYLAAAQALLSYSDPKVNHRIREAKKKNGNLNKDWGGEAFNKLLKEYNLK